MAINNNIFTEIGDKLFLNAQIAVFGVFQLTGIVESYEGETSTRFFIKKYKSSTDNVNWTDWQDLTLLNLQSLNGRVLEVLFLQFVYERAGTDATGYLRFKNLSFTGSMIITINDYSTTNESLFSELVENDAVTVTIANNLLKKIYGRGILPKYLSRHDDSEDFLAFWSSICTYFAYIVALANKFDDILNEKGFLAEYLSQRGIKFVKDEITITELQYIANNLVDEFRKRGTKSMIVEQGHEFADGYINPINGEWLRLIGKNHYDEFLVEFIKKEECGYYADVSSSNYNGTNHSVQINKTGFNEVDFPPLINFRVLNNGAGLSIDGDAVGNILTIKPDIINPLTANTWGIGEDLDNISAEAPSGNLITVDDEIDYELTFNIRNSGPSTSLIRFGLLSYNINNFFIPDGLQNATTGVPSVLFYEEQKSKLFLIPDQWYAIRCIVYGRGSQSSNILPEFGLNKLRFAATKDIAKVMPFVQLNDVDGNMLDEEINISDWKFRPLIRGKHILPTLESVLVGSEYVTVEEDTYICNPSFLQNDASVLSWSKNNTTQDDKSVQTHHRDSRRQRARDGGRQGL